MKTCYSHIKAFERKTLRKLLDMGCSTAKIAYVLERSRSTIHRELERNGYTDKSGKLVYDPEYAHLQSRRRKMQAGYGKGHRIRGYANRRSYFDTLFLPPVSYRPQFGRWRYYWVHEFKNRKKDLRAYCALSYYWNRTLGRIWRKKYKQRRYHYSQPPGFPLKRTNRRRPLYFWVTDRQDFRVWKKRKRKLRAYSFLELEVMKMCRKKRIRKTRRQPAPLLYNWPDRFWEIEGEADRPEIKHSEPSKSLNERTTGLSEMIVLTSKYGRGASDKDPSERNFKIYPPFGRGQVHLFQKIPA